MSGEWEGGKGSKSRVSDHKMYHEKASFLDKKIYKCYLKYHEDKPSTYIGSVEASSTYMAARYMGYDIDELYFEEVTE